MNLFRNLFIDITTPQVSLSVPLLPLGYIFSFQQDLQPLSCCGRRVNINVTDFGEITCHFQYDELVVNESTSLNVNLENADESVLQSESRGAYREAQEYVLQWPIYKETSPERGTIFRLHIYERVAGTLPKRFNLLLRKIKVEKSCSHIKDSSFTA